MLSSLKKKLSNALQEASVITENLQQQYRQRNQSSSSVSLSSSRSSLALSTELGIPQNVNVAAGCNLLAKYEDDWKIISKVNDENAKKANDVASQIQNVEKAMTQQQVVMTDLVHCLSGIPSLVQKLKDCSADLDNVQELSGVIERELDKLEDLCAECELQEYILEKQCELSKHKQKKMEELELYRQKVAADHQQRIRQHEEKLRQLQKERQAVFDDAFRTDLAEYKQNGHIAKIHKDLNREVSLDQVELDDTENKDALEEFLNG